MVEIRTRDVARGIAREHAHRRVDVLVEQEREECDAKRGVCDLHAFDRRP